MEANSNSNSPQPFLALTKSATSPRAAADLVVRATSAPNAYLFTELLEAPQIQALSTVTESASYLKLLEIFSYGTYSSYTSAAAEDKNFPVLNDAQKLKLRQLSLLTLAKENGSDRTTSPALAYGSLVQSLGLTNPRELEEVVISAIYAGLLNAQLDPKNEQVLINSVSPLRDVAPGDGAISGLLSSLQAFAGRCDATLHSLEEQMSRLRADANKRAADKAAMASKMDNLVKEEEKGGAAPSDHGGNTQTSRMLTDGALSFPGGGGAPGRSGGGGRSLLPPGTRFKGLSSSSAAANNGNNPLTHLPPSQRQGKRVASSSQADGEDEAMDLDDEEELGEGGMKRASKRKL